MAQKDEWLSSREAAELLGFSKETVNGMFTRGELPGAHKRNSLRNNSPLRIPRKAIDDMLKEFEAAKNEAPKKKRAQEGD
jgi:Helix-turn-helix domain